MSYQRFQAAFEFVTEPVRVGWVPWDMVALSEVMDRGNGPRMWRIAANVLNK
jgi:hypothetical protein